MMNRGLVVAAIMLISGVLACAPGAGLQTAIPTVTPTIPARPAQINTPLPSATPVPDLPDLSGQYDVLGTNFDGSTYSGSVALTRLPGSNDYNVVWSIGPTKQTGQGVFDGTVLDVRWQQGPEIGGTATYTLQPDGTLVGTWTVDGVEGQGGETFIPR